MSTTTTTTKKTIALDVQRANAAKPSDVLSGKYTLLNILTSFAIAKYGSTTKSTDVHFREYVVLQAPTELTPKGLGLLGQDLQGDIKLTLLGCDSDEVKVDQYSIDKPFKPGYLGVSENEAAHTATVDIECIFSFRSNAGYKRSSEEVQPLPEKKTCPPPPVSPSSPPSISGRASVGPIACQFCLKPNCFGKCMRQLLASSSSSTPTTNALKPISSQTHGSYCYCTSCRSGSVK
jgi:hypothetical protein